VTDFALPRPSNCQCPPAWRLHVLTLNTDGPLETHADSPASDVADVLTNQSAYTRAQGYIGHCARFALISAHYWQLFKSYNHRRRAACVCQRRSQRRRRNADRTECRPPKTAVCGGTDDPSHTANHQLAARHVVNPVGRHSGRSALRHRSNIQTSPLQTFRCRFEHSLLKCSREFVRAFGYMTQTGKMPFRPISCIVYLPKVPPYNFSGAFLHHDPHLTRMAAVTAGPSHPAARSTLYTVL